MSVVVYTTPSCGFCQQVMVQLSGQRGVPVVLIDGQTIRTMVRF